MSFEETDTEDSSSSLSELSFLDDDLDRMHVESESSDDEMSSNVWKEIKSESDEEFMEDHGLVEEVTSAPEDHIVNGNQPLMKKCSSSLGLLSRWG
jgi:hypothetical protein